MRYEITITITRNGKNLGDHHHEVDAENYFHALEIAGNICRDYHDSDVDARCTIKVREIQQ